MHKRIFQQIRYQDSSQNLIHPYNKIICFFHTDLNFFIGIYILIIIDIPFHQTVHVNLLLFHKLAIVYFRQQQQGTVQLTGIFQCLIGAGYFLQLIFGQSLIFHQHFKSIHAYRQWSLHFVGCISNEKFLLLVNFLIMRGKTYNRFIQFLEFSGIRRILQHCLTCAQTILFQPLQQTIKRLHAFPKHPHIDNQNYN